MRITSVHLKLMRELRDQGLSFTVISHKIGCDPRTVIYWLNPKFRARAMKTGREAYHIKKQKEAAE